MVDAELTEIAASGIAWDIKEHADGIGAVGSAFVDRLGRDFPLSIPAPTARFAAKCDQLGRAVLSAVAAIVRLVPEAAFQLGRARQQIP